jgi:hypothetical protein
MTQPLPDAPAHTPPRLHRGLRFALRRHRTLAIAAFCLAASAILLAAPFLKRSYALAGNLHVSLRPFDPVPELSRVVESTARELDPDIRNADVDLAITAPSPDTRNLRLSASGGTRDAEFVRVKNLADRFTTTLRHRADELLSAYASSLDKQSIRLDADEAAVNRDLDAFRQSHRGALPDDPDSILKQYDKLTTLLDDKQSRLRITNEQITRVEEYKKGARPLAPAPLLPAANTTNAPAPAPTPAADPEVATLTAQVQLLNDQINEQLNDKGRTEQHPYVVDLKHKLADAQEKLDAAKQRAANGQPPPPDAHLPAAPAGTPANDPSLIAAQAADMQLATLHAEKDDLETQVKTLLAQRDAMQKSVDSLDAVRRQYKDLTDKLADIKKSRQDLAAKRDAYNHQFGGGEVAAPAIVEVSNLALDQPGTNPTWPTLPAVLAAAIAAGLLAALLLPFLLAKTDRSLHSPAEAAALLDTPILGAIPAIHSPAAKTLHRLNHALLQPLLLLLFISLFLASLYLCHRHLNNPNFGQLGTHDPARMLLSFNDRSAP